MKIVWVISPHDDTSYDFIQMPAEGPTDHRAALEYAKNMLEILWDDCEIGDKVEVTMELKEQPNEQ